MTHRFHKIQSQPWNKKPSIVVAVNNIIPQQNFLLVVPMLKLVNVDNVFDWKILLINGLIKLNLSMNPMNYFKISSFSYLDFCLKRLKKKNVLIMMALVVYSY